jgi:hypothetical protein
MKIYGVGLFLAPNSSRVVWDFVDGPFDTVNPILIQEAKRRGFSFSSPTIKEMNISATPNSSAKEAKPIEKKRAGRPKKVQDANEIESATCIPMGNRSEASEEVRSGNTQGKEVASEEKEGE